MAIDELRGRRNRVELVLAGDRAGSRRHRELVAFARYCITRIERQIGETGHWMVHVAPAAGGFKSMIVVANTEAVATGFDAPLAIWDAMCRVEERLLSARGTR